MSVRSRPVSVRCPFLETAEFEEGAEPNVMIREEAGEYGKIVASAHGINTKT